MDFNLLKFLYDDNQKVEPEWYIPIIPMVLVNGAEGIGTGWACKIPNYDPREIVNNINRMLNHQDPLPMVNKDTACLLSHDGCYKNFKGLIHELGHNQYLVSGEVSVIDKNTIEITELPVRTWTQAYKESVLEPMLQGTDKTPALISDYKEYHTDATVKFVVRMSEEKLAQAEAVGLHKVFKLQSSLTCNSMVLFDHMGCLKRYDSVQDILKEFFELRLHYYKLRKDWLLGSLGAEASKLSNQARFVLEKIEGKISIATAKKVKKRNPWSDDESKSDSDLEDNEPIIPRETKSQRASGRTVTKTQARSSPPTPAAQRLTKYRQQRKKPQKPPSDDEDEDEEDDDNSLSTARAPSRDRPGRARKEVKYYHDSENEEDDDDMFD
ncbi:DNA topoisomerase 2-beta [Goodea atripinnis]|uniref:DNA topoisomerase 2-beta n=1 Tax=Goodea atripinnis TaxID=208336 RepID=A0ABV0MET6_9TELE